jgi:hypothetical protein
MGIILFLAAAGTAAAIFSFFDKLAGVSGRDPRWVPIVGCTVLILLAAIGAWAFVLSIPRLPD